LSANSIGSVPNTSDGSSMARTHRLIDPDWELNARHDAIS
jgi:hypothetical protein